MPGMHTLAGDAVRSGEVGRDRAAFSVLVRATKEGNRVADDTPEDLNCLTTANWAMIVDAPFLKRLSALMFLLI